MSMIWPHTVVEENSLNRNISLLRRILGEKPGDHSFIVTAPGQGYRFVAVVNGAKPAHGISRRDRGNRGDLGDDIEDPVASGTNSVAVLPSGFNTGYPMLLENRSDSHDAHWSSTSRSGAPTSRSRTTTWSPCSSHSRTEPGPTPSFLLTATGTEIWLRTPNGRSIVARHDRVDQAASDSETVQAGTAARSLASSVTSLTRICLANAMNRAS